MKMKTSSTEKKAIGAYETNVSKFNSWEEFCRMSHGQASLFDRIVYLYGLRLSEGQDSDDNHESAIQSRIPEYESVYYTDVTNVYNRLSISHLQTLKTNLLKINALREKLKRQVNNPSAKDIEWDEDTSEQKLHEASRVTCRKLISDLEKEIARKKWEAWRRRMKPLMATAACLLFIVVAYLGVLLFQYQSFYSHLSQLDKDLLALRQKTADNSWLKNPNPGKWKKQSSDAGELYEKCSKTKVPFLLAHDLVSSFYKISASVKSESSENDNSPYEKSIDERSKNALEYKRFALAVHLCEETLKRYEKERDINLLVNTFNPCWLQLYQPNFGYEKEPGKSTYPLITIGEKQKTLKLINDRNGLVVKLWTQLKSDFNQLVDSSDFVKLENCYRQLVDLYTILEQNQTEKANKDLTAYKNELTSIGGKIFEKQVRLLHSEAITVLNDRERSILQCLEAMDAAIDRLQQIPQRIFMPDKDYQSVISKMNVKLGEYRNEISDRNREAKMSDLDSRLDELTTPAYDENSTLTVLQNANGALSQFILELQGSKNSLSINSVVSQKAKTHKERLQSKISSKIDLFNNNKATVQKLISRKLDEGRTNDVKSAYESLSLIEKKSQVIIDAPQIEQLKNGIEELNDNLPVWKSQAKSNSGMQDVVDEGQRLLRQINNRIEEVYSTSVERLMAKGHMDVNIKRCNNSTLDSFLTDLSDAESELKTMRNSSLPSDVIASIKNNLEILDKRKVDIGNQIQYNNLLSELGLKTLSRASISQFLNRLKEAQNKLDSHWNNTHLEEDAELLRSQIRQYIKYYNELVTLREYCGTYSMRNGEYTYSKGSLISFRNQIARIQDQVRKHEYDDILSDIHDFQNAFSWNYTQDAFVINKPNSPFKFIGFLDRDPGNEKTGRYVIRYRNTTYELSKQMVLLRGMIDGAPDTFALCKLVYNTKGAVPEQHFQSSGIDSYLGRPVYMFTED